jgi:hypothetical protein
MKYLQSFTPPPIISIPKKDWYDADHPPLAVRIRVFLAVVIALVHAAPLPTIGRPAPFVWLRLSEPAIRVLAAALVIQAAIWLAGLISPAYIEGGACAI